MSNAFEKSVNVMVAYLFVFLSSRMALSIATIASLVTTLALNSVCEHDTVALKISLGLKLMIAVKNLKEWSFSSVIGR